MVLFPFCSNILRLMTDLISASSITKESHFTSLLPFRYYGKGGGNIWSPEKAEKINIFKLEENEYWMFQREQPFGAPKKILPAGWVPWPDHSQQEKCKKGPAQAEATGANCLGMGWGWSRVWKALNCQGCPGTALLGPPSPEDAGGGAGGHRPGSRMAEQWGGGWALPLGMGTKDRSLSCLASCTAPKPSNLQQFVG